MAPGQGLKGFPTCDHTDTKIRKKQASNGTWQYSKQCLCCGRRVGNFLPKLLACSKGPVEVWDQDLEKRHEQEYKDAYARRQHEMALQKSVEDAAWWERYEVYMRSDKWRDLRRMIILRCGNVCEGCGRKPVAHVHHLTYEHFGDELLWELRGACVQCHERVHGRPIG